MIVIAFSTIGAIFVELCVGTKKHMDEDNKRPPQIPNLDEGGNNIDIAVQIGTL